MKNCKLLFLIFTFAQAFSCTDSKEICVDKNTASYNDSIFTRVNLYEVENYDNEYISISGWYRGGMENSALYLSKDDARNLVRNEAVWLDGGPSCKKFPENPLCVHGYKKINVKGFLSLDDKGHFNSFIGTLKVLCVMEID